jgi:hypothetical protein
MLSVATFDPWKRDDVAANSQANLKRLEDGSIPCDSPRPTDRVDIYRRWIDTGEAAP